MCVSLCQSEPVIASALSGQKRVPTPSRLYFGEPIGGAAIFWGHSVHQCSLLVVLNVLCRVSWY